MAKNGRKHLGGLWHAARAGEPLAIYITQNAPLPLLVLVGLYFAHGHNNLVPAAIVWMTGALCFQVPWVRYLRTQQSPPSNVAQSIAAATTTTAIVFAPEFWLLSVAFCTMGLVLALISGKIGSAAFQLACVLLGAGLAWRQDLLTGGPWWTFVALVLPMALAAGAFVASDLAWEKRYLSSSLASSGATAWDVDSEGQIIRVLGLPFAGLEAGCFIKDALHPSDQRPDSPEPGSTLQYRVKCPEMGWRWIRENIEAESIGSPTRRSGVLDISDELERSELLRKRATVDDLTARPNRASHMALSTEWARRGNGFLLLVDLDNFKGVNDTLGHTTGDRVLAAVAQRFARVPGCAEIARLGGDEFAMMFEGDVAGAEAIASQLSAVASEPFTVENMVISTGASTGLAYFELGVGADEIRRRAGVALREAKDKGFEHIVYDETLERMSARRKDLVLRLPAALASGQFVIHHQIKVDLRSGDIIGTEALVRWQHPELGLVMPGEFLDLIKVGGHHRTLLEIVLSAALNELAQVIAETGNSELSVSVNMNSRNIREIDLIERVANALQASGLSAHNLTFELTEHTFVGEDERVLTALRRLSDLGIRLSIDDFGTGYSSLGYLARLPVQEVKLDRSLVHEISESPRDRAVVEAVLDLANRLDLTVVAEGIEDSRMLEQLTEMGCAIGQGFFIGRPMPIKEIDFDQGHLPHASLVRPDRRTTS